MVTVEQLRKAAAEAKAANIMQLQAKIAVLIDLLIQKADELDMELARVEVDVVKLMGELKNGKG